MNIAEKTTERLADFGAFEQGTIENVAGVAEFQSSFSTYQEYFAQTGVPEPQVYSSDGKNSVAIANFQHEDWDGRTAIAYHIGHVNPLDSNQLYQASTISLVFPQARLIAVGSRCLDYPGGVLDKDDRRSVASGNFRPVIEQALRYIEQQKIDLVIPIGMSKGAEMAFAQAAESDTEVVQSVGLEPVGSKIHRVPGLRLAQLLGRFSRTASSAQGYFEDTGLDTFLEAQDDAMSTKEFYGSLLAPTNIAIARGMALGGTENRIVTALLRHKSLKVTTWWGSKSELAKHDEIVPMNDHLELTFLGRYQARELKGARHAFTNDIHLQVACVAESILNK